MLDLSSLSLVDLEALASEVGAERDRRAKIRAKIMPRAVLTGDHIADIKAYRAQHGTSLFESRAAVLLAEGRL
jgi:hypothetical protein